MPKKAGECWGAPAAHSTLSFLPFSPPLPSLCLTPTHPYPSHLTPHTSHLSRSPPWLPLPHSLTMTPLCTSYFGSGGTTLASVAVSTITSGWSGPFTLAGLCVVVCCEGVCVCLYVVGRGERRGRGAGQGRRGRRVCVWVSGCVQSLTGWCLPRGWVFKQHPASKTNNDTTHLHAFTWTPPSCTPPHTCYPHTFTYMTKHYHMLSIHMPTHSCYPHTCPQTHAPTLSALPHPHTHSPPTLSPHPPHPHLYME